MARRTRSFKSARLTKGGALCQSDELARAAKGARTSSIFYRMTTARQTRELARSGKILDENCIFFAFGHHLARCVSP
jgi:hypothetical protein